MSAEIVSYLKLFSSKVSLMYTADILKVYHWLKLTSEIQAHKKYSLNISLKMSKVLGIWGLVLHIVMLAVGGWLIHTD